MNDPTVLNNPKSRIEDPFLFLLEFIVMYIDSKHQWQVRLIICVRNFHKTTKSIQETARKKASALLSLRLALSHIHPYIAASQALLCYPATHATWLGTANRDPRQHGKVDSSQKSPKISGNWLAGLLTCFMLLSVFIKYPVSFMSRTRTITQTYSLSVYQAWSKSVTTA